MKTKNKNHILIGGGAGYIGSSLVPELVHEGYKVTVVDLLWFGNNLPREVRVIKKDLFSLDRNDFKDMDQFIFLAGISNDPMAHFKPRLNYMYNAALPAYLAFEAKKAGVKRYIYGSSCSVYGDTQKTCIETSPTNTIEPYGISKLQGEFGVLSNCDANFSTIVLRQGTVCGVSPRMRFDLVVNTMVKTALIEKQIVVDNPTVWRPICAMSDVLNAYMRSLKAKKNINGIFNISSGNFEVITIAKTVQREIKNLLGIDIDVIVNDEPTLRNYKVAILRGKKILGYSPSKSLSALIRELILYIRNIKDYNNIRYYNIKTFKHLDL